MRPGTFTDIEQAEGQIIKAQFVETANAAHREELIWAEQNNQHFRGLPYIRVMVDGGWGKQSHGHSYNSSTGEIITWKHSFIFRFVQALINFVVVLS